MIIGAFAEQALAQFPTQPIKINVRHETPLGPATVASILVLDGGDRWGISRALPRHQQERVGYVREVARFMASKLASRAFA